MGCLRVFMVCCVLVISGITFFVLEKWVGLPQTKLLPKRRARVSQTEPEPAPEQGLPCLELLVLVVLVVLVVFGVLDGGPDAINDGLDLVLQVQPPVLDVLEVGLHVLVQPVQGRLHGLLQRLLVVLLDELRLLIHQFLHREHGVLQRVPLSDLGLHLLVLLLKLLRLGHHALNLFVRKAALLVHDGDLLLLVRGLLDGRHLQDAVRVHLEGHLDLRGASWGGGNLGQVELAQLVAVLGLGALPLKDLDRHGGLLVLVGGEGLRLLGGDHGVSGDELGQDASHGLNAEGERGHVQQQQRVRLLAALSREDAALHGRAVGHRLVRVDALGGLLAVKVVLEHALHLWDARGPAHQHDVVDLALLKASVVHGLLHRGEGLLEQVRVQLLEPGSGEGLGQVDVADEGLDLDSDLVLGGEGALGALGLPPELLHGALVGGDVLLVLLLDQLDEVLHHALVEVLASQVRVSVRGDDLEDAIVDGEDGHVEGAAAQVKDQNVLLPTLLVQPVGDGRGRGLVDDPGHVQARDGAGVLGGLALRVVEVGGHRHHGVLHLLAQETFRNLLHLAQNHGRDLLRGKDLHVARLHLGAHVGLLVLLNDVETQQLLVLLHRLVAELPADEALHVINGAVRVGGRLVLGGVANEALVVREGHVRGGDAVTLLVRDDLHAPVLVDTDATVRGAQVDPDGGAQLALVAVLLVSRHHHGARDDEEGQGQGRHRARGRPAAEGGHLLMHSLHHGVWSWFS
mmetsp:Transcript_9027/g.22262  ORF Transcript_9027/g.22262 Transcript_9027/m.22262 type:complete len:741 (-) Transcript_9027:31-2253(-)